MTLTFLTNFINHHQVPLADEYYKILGDSYHFVATIPIPESFARNGYSDYEKPYLLKAYESREKYQEMVDLCNTSDVVVIGAAPYSLVAERLRQNKVTFCDDEKMFKGYLKDCWLDWKYWLRPILKMYQHTKYRFKPYYLLGASAYVSRDVHRIGAFPNKCYKWGYFTVVPELDIRVIMTQKKDTTIRILWVSRFIELKHPELMIKLAVYLDKKGYDFIINMVGSGNLLDKFHKMIAENHLVDRINLVGSIPNSEVLNMMKSHHIFCFTSDKNEGWGAVLNEAMSHGCCAVASNKIGAAPFLIDDGVNGLLYETGKPETFFEKVEYLINNPRQRDEMTIAAYIKMRNLWSPKNAAQSFVELAQSKLEGRKCKITAGPCSVAPIID